MKTKMKLILGITVFTVLLSFTTSAQDSLVTQKRNNYFYIGPVDLFLNTLQLGYERKLSNHNTIAFFSGFKLSKKDEAIDRVGANGEFQYRINLLYNKEALSSKIRNHSTFAYFAPFVQYKYEEANDITSLTDGNSKTTTTYINSGFGGLGFGIRLSGLQNRFSLNLFAGGGMKYSQVKGDKRYEEFMQAGYTGIAPKVEFHMGIAF